MKSYMAKKGEVEQKWLLIDLEGKILGRAASQVANLLRGKHKPQFTPHTDTGDFVVAINSSKVKLTGNKLRDKIYYRVGRKLGHMKEMSAGEMRSKKPTKMFELAVKRMLPRNTLAHAMIKKLKVYSGSDHPHAAQSPKPLTVEK